MIYRSLIQSAIFSLCVSITAQLCYICPTAYGQDTSAEDINPLFVELAKAKFVDHTTKEVIEELEGKVVGVYFTAKWCVACRTFTPKLVKLRNDNPDEFQFVVASWDDSLKDEKAYLAKAKMSAPAIRFDDPLTQEYNERYAIDGVPTLHVYDRNGKLITTKGWECMVHTLRPGVLEKLNESEDELAWQRMVRPFQEELQAKRVANLEKMKPTIEKYKDFPHMDEIADWLGYYGTADTVGEIMRTVGKEMAADWENQKHHLDYLSDLAIALKPQSDGYIGVLESWPAGCLFEELGKASVKNRKILEKLNRMASGETGKRYHRNWAMAGLVASALHGNDEAMKQVVDWRNTIGGGSHAPLKIYPILYPACHEGDSRALQMAKQIYVGDPYYVYKALPAFVIPALDGNEMAIESLGLIAAVEDRHGYHKHAMRFLNEAADKGHAKAKEVLMALKDPKEEEPTEDPIATADPQAPAQGEGTEDRNDSKAAEAFAAQLGKDCYLYLGEKLSPVSKDTFAGTELYVVYYSHIDCTGCVVITEAINKWYSMNPIRPGLSLVFATRGEKSNEDLARYLKKAKIEYPAIDSKYYMAREKENPHPFYEDCDDGVPFIRFFDRFGNAINPTKHGIKDIYDCDSIIENLDETINSMLRTVK